MLAITSVPALPAAAEPSSCGLGELPGGTSESHGIGVSDGGTVIVDYGTGPQCYMEGWVAVIPEPATGVLLTLAGTVARRKRR
jgi:hypothetical protein